MACNCSVINFFKKLFTPKQCACSGGTCDISVKKTLLNITDEDVEILKKLDENIVVGRILEIRKHKDPKITKVQVTQCDLGNGEKEQILCGGVNIKEGQVVPVAKIGTKLAEDFEIGERDIRGEVSRGMICARSELGVSLAGEEKGYIWELPKEAGMFLGKKVKDLIS